jgi:hypothetical protein
VENFAVTTHKGHRIKISSCILASLYLLFGAVLFHVLPQFEGIFAGFNVPLNFWMRAMFAIGACGWLCLAAEVAIFIVLKDLRFGSRFLNLFFTLVFLFWVGCTAYALFSPLFFYDNVGIH